MKLLLGCGRTGLSIILSALVNGDTVNLVPPRCLRATKSYASPSPPRPVRTTPVARTIGRPTRALLSFLSAVTAAATTAPTPAAAADNLACKLTVAGTFYQYGHCTTLHHDPNVPITLLWKTNATHFWAGMTSPTAGPPLRSATTTCTANRHRP